MNNPGHPKPPDYVLSPSSPCPPPPQFRAQPSLALINIFLTSLQIISCPLQSIFPLTAERHVLKWWCIFKLEHLLASLILFFKIKNKTLYMSGRHNCLHPYISPHLSSPWPIPSRKLEKLNTHFSRLPCTYS